jgi:sigma-B regulation protein RsbU (phosphoserine phosphatase)
MGKRTVDFYHDPAERDALIAVLRRDGRLRERELRVVRPDGSLFWAMISVDPVKFEGADALMCGLVDLSEHKQAQAELERVVRVLEERDAVLTRDLERARAFQENMLPHGLSHGDVRIEAAFVPLDQVSGDLYDVDIVGDHLRLFIADATGHGVSAALTTMFLRSEYEVACQAGRRSGDILRALNARIARFASRLTMRFTAACLLLDLRSGELTWATAAHPPPCVKIDGRVVELDSGGPFVGLVPDAEFPEFRTVLPPGATLCLYTDGVTEALAPDGQPFGERRLYDVLGAARADLASAALSAARGFAGTLQDDVTVLTAEWRPRLHRHT